MVKYKRTVKSFSKIEVLMPEIQLTVPTDLTKKRCLTLKIKSEFNFTKESDEKRF